MRPSEFPYRAMSDDLVRHQSFDAADAMKQDLRGIATLARSLGERLDAVRRELPSGLFRAWLHSEFLWNEGIAEGLVQIAARHDRTLTEADLGASVAAGQLERARALLNAYREILRTDPAFAAVPRRMCRDVRQDRPVRGRIRRIGVRARRRLPDDEENRG